MPKLEDCASFCGHCFCCSAWIVSSLGALLYDPVYSADQVKQLFRDHRAEFSELAQEWDGQFRSLEVEYQPYKGQTLSVVADIFPR